MMRRLHSAPKPAPRVPRYMSLKRFRFRARRIADAVVTRQIRTGLGGGDDVVAGDRVLRGRQADFANFAAQLSRAVQRPWRSGRPFRSPVLRNTRAAGRSSCPSRCHPVAPDNPAPGRRPRWRPSRRGRRSFASSSAASRTVRAKRADVIERAGECHQAVARNAAVGRRDAHYAAEGRRLPNGSAGIGSQRDHGRSLRHCRSRTAARSSRHAIERHRIPHRSKRGVFVRGAHGELVAIGFADDDAAGLFQAHHRGGVVRRDVMLQQARAAGGPNAFGDDHVLHRHGYARQRAGIFAGG